MIITRTSSEIFVHKQHMDYIHTTKNLDQVYTTKTCWK